MRVLQLVPSAGSTAYRGQVRALRRRGVDCATLAVPGSHVPGEQTRSVLDYLRHLGQTGPRVAPRVRPRPRESGRRRPDGPRCGGVADRGLAVGTDLYGPLGPVSRGCARVADAVVVMSRRMAADLGGDCRVIPHGVDTEQFRPLDRRLARRELGWDDGRLHVLYPYDTARPVKNFPRAERIVGSVADRISGEIALNVVTGVPHERMPAYMNAADALLLTSAHEGSPNAVKEALACNLPVVSTPVGDVPERLAGVRPSATAATDEGLVASDPRSVGEVLRIRPSVACEGPSGRSEAPACV